MLNGMNITKPFNVQANLCKLNPGVSEEDYDEMLDDYFDWAKKNGVEPVFVRQKPVFSHANANNPWPYDFVEFLAMDDYERWGKILGHVAHVRGWRSAKRTLAITCDVQRKAGTRASPICRCGGNAE